MRARNLEDRAREQLWIDTATGAPAVGERRQPDPELRVEAVQLNRVP